MTSSPTPNYEIRAYVAAFTLESDTQFDGSHRAGWLAAITRAGGALDGKVFFTGEFAGTEIPSEDGEDFLPHKDEIEAWAATKAAEYQKVYRAGFGGAEAPTRVFKIGTYVNSYYYRDAAGHWCSIRKTFEVGPNEDNTLQFGGEVEGKKYAFDVVTRVFRKF